MIKYRFWCKWHLKHSENIMSSTIWIFRQFGPIPATLHIAKIIKSIKKKLISQNLINRPESAGNRLWEAPDRVWGLQKGEGSTEKVPIDPQLRGFGYKSFVEASGGNKISPTFRPIFRDPQIPLHFHCNSEQTPNRYESGKRGGIAQICSNVPPE